MEKSELRKIIKEKARTATPGYFSEASAEIRQHICNSEYFKSADTIFIYLNMRGEPETRRLIEEGWKAGKHMVIPKCFPDGRMDAFEITNWDLIAPGMNGTMEPIDGSHAIDKNKIDLAIIPCVSAGKDGSRLGHGAGYYDRYLENTNFPKVCLCFEFLISAEIPMDEHDKPMNAIITENGIFQC